MIITYERIAKIANENSAFFIETVNDVCNTIDLWENVLRHFGVEPYYGDDGLEINTKNITMYQMVQHAMEIQHAVGVVETSPKQNHFDDEFTAMVGHIMDEWDDGEIKELFACIIVAMGELK